MKIVALIPIKLNNRRLPNKNTKPFFDGTALINFIQKACLASNEINETYVYCSDDSIKDFIITGIKFLKRPKFLDEDSANANDIIREFMKEVDADIYVNTHATAPFAKASSFDECIKQVKSGKYDSAFCAENLKTFLWQDGHPLNFDPSNFPRTQDLPDIYAEVSNSYIFTKETFKFYNRRVGKKPYIHIVDKIEAIDIDYPQDFEIANAIYKEIIKNGNSNS